MANVKFQPKKQFPNLMYFQDLGLNQSFKVDSPNSKGAVYRKTFDTILGEFRQTEEKTGNSFRPTSSPVVIVDVDVTVNSQDYNPRTPF